MYSYQDEIRSYFEDVDPNYTKSDFRTPFRRDYARVLHSAAFRRLQGKTQLFPCMESDFFRNRLTHSLEVAQIAKSIALLINKKYLSDKTESQLINLDLVEFAGITHDLGHPPFGHQGEVALNEKMSLYGGFEGNAQTLRILAKIEKKVHTGDLDLSGFDEFGVDKREGLNLTYRSLASILKYDEQIPVLDKDNSNRGKIIKGYYASEHDLVTKIKANVTNGKPYQGSFKTIECKIMDIADDIAYSTFDIEDVFKSGFFNPFDILTATNQFYDEVATSVTSSMTSNGYEVEDYNRDNILNIISDVFKGLFDLQYLEGIDELEKARIQTEEFVFMSSQYAYKVSKLLAHNGYIRSRFMSKLINDAINAIEFVYNEDIPALSDVKLTKVARERIEVLKRIAFQSQILSPKLKIVEFRGKEIVRKIFDVLSLEGGDWLLPDDIQTLYRIKNDEAHKARVICDFIACMTDRYAIEFYGRLTSENPETIFKPLN